MKPFLPPPPPVKDPFASPSKGFSMAAFSSPSPITGRWESVDCAETQKGSVVPCQRSLHAGAVWKDNFIVFGGYDGARRVNDLYQFGFKTNLWTLLTSVNAPTARDRHVAVVYENSLYIFGGFDGVARVNDLHAFDLEAQKWEQVIPSSGEPPTPRHSHASVVYKDSMFVFGGYDGSYRCDFNAFNLQTRTWRLIAGAGEVPKARYRGTCVVSGDTMILHGGHDGNRHLQDTHIFDFTMSSWSTLVTEGPIPSPRDSHVAVIFNKSMFLYGGSTGSAMGDFHELKLEFRRLWRPVVSSSTHYTSSNAIYSASPSSALSPGPRFCHVGVVYDGGFYIFGGYDGANRLNDFLRYRFEVDDGPLAATPSTIIADIRKYVNNDLLSDIQFIIEGQAVFAHKILCLRCPYFHNMLTGEYMESRASAITIPDVKYNTFVLLMEYLYTDDVAISIDTAMELFQVADRFGIDRLKTLCEQEMLRAIDIDTAAHILFTADEHHAENLRERCMNFILLHFDEVSRTGGFEEMGRTNVDLIFEILRRR